MPEVLEYAHSGSTHTYSTEVQWLMMMSEHAQKHSQGRLCAKTKVYLRENININ